MYVNKAVVHIKDFTSPLIIVILYVYSSVFV
jgi:hypothetical protein